MHKKKKAKKAERIPGQVSGPAEIRPSHPWMLVKHIVSNKCRCVDSRKVIPNLLTWFVMDYKRDEHTCKQAVEHCDKVQI